MTDNNHKQIKRFVAPTMTRALELVQRELGPEAVILSSQRVKNGIEIVTSLEPDLPTRGIDVRREFGQNFDAELDTSMPSDSAWRSQAGIEKAAASFGGRTEQNNKVAFEKKPPSDLAKEIEAARERMFAAKRRAKEDAELNSPRNPPIAEPSIEPQASPSPFTVASAPSHEAVSSVNAASNGLVEEDRQHIESLKNEIADMRMLLEQQLWQNVGQEQPLMSLGMPRQVSMPNHYPVLTEHLNRVGLTTSVVESLISEVGHHARASIAWRECMGVLAKRLPIAKNSILDDGGIYAFLGQTGVGKTTTIAKLAAQYVLKNGPGKVALVTTDTYRVGAFDQLRTMGKILNVPVKIVDAENSLVTVLASLRQFPLVLIDTAGFRVGDPLLKLQLKQLQTSQAVQRVIVLSCNSQIAMMKASFHAHKGNGDFHSCILTKLDESASIGEALSTVMAERVPVSYSTDGQNIPNDISSATGHGLVAKAVSIMRSQSPSEQGAAVL